MDTKNSFILYTEYYDIICKLSDEQLGLLTRAIFLHEKGEDVPEMELALDLVFGFITNQLDRDREKYEETRKKRSEAGKKGGEKSGESRKPKEEANPSHDSFAEANEANASSASNCEANEADNVDVDVNVNENENEDVNVDVAAELPDARTGAQAAATDKQDETTVAKKTTVAQSSAADQATNLPPPQPASADVAISLPLCDGGVYDVTHMDVARLVELFPETDIIESLKKYQHWLMDYPRRMPGAKLMPDRIQDWLKRERSGPPKAVDEEQFEAFWAAYPKKRSKGLARKAFAKISSEQYDAVMAGLERAKTSYDWQKENGQYIQNADTWLDAEGWLDETFSQKPKGDNSALGYEQRQYEASELEGLIDEL